MAGLDEHAAPVLQAVLAGEMEPLEGAVRLAGHWAPVEPDSQEGGKVPGKHRSPPGFDGLYAVVLDLFDSGRSEQACRIAEFQWHVAQRIGTDELILLCAAQLGQTLRDDPASGQRRLELLEFAVPELVTWPRPTEEKARLLHHLAMARQDEAAGDPDALHAAIEACEQALALGGLEDEISACLHFLAGQCGSMANGTAADLEKAVLHLREAVQLINRLGGSLPQKVAQETLDTATRIWQAALTGGASRPVDASEYLLKTPLEEGDTALNASLSQPTRQDAYRLRALQKYLVAAERIGGGARPGMRAEVQHRMAALLLEAVDEDELWTGVCFAAAARRLGRHDWHPANHVRVNTHLARLLMRLGMTDDPRLLRTASELQRQAVPLIEADGSPGEAERLNRDYRSCLVLLAIHGDEEVASTALELEGAHQLSRLREELAEVPEGEEAPPHHAYLRTVLDEAGGRLASFLARGEIARGTLIVSQGLAEEKALALLEEARRRRDAGDFMGAADFVSTALTLVQDVYAYTVVPWCEAAELCAGMSLKEDAESLLDEARALMSLARDPQETVTGYVPGNWFAVLGLDHYWERIERASTRVRELAAKAPQFDPAATAHLLQPEDDLCRNTLATALLRRLEQHKEQGAQ
ncbi:hypothetical protein ACIQ7Q_25875 [Streptomyces sp. NPDC096176]|uniref:hypothetical protein n=1 Tax=Streptomyces sp. NPDC096176 TaxID=3366079 RepID=UPI003815BCD8